MDCIFCKIASGKAPSEAVYEDGGIKAFLSIKPSAPVHILVIPKEHIESIAHLTEGRGALVAELIYRAKRIAEEKGLAGYKLVFNVGREGGQVVGHLHLHLLGGWGIRDNPDDYRV